MCVGVGASVFCPSDLPLILFITVRIQMLRKSNDFTDGCPSDTVGEGPDSTEQTSSYRDPLCTNPTVQGPPPPEHGKS